MAGLGLGPRPRVRQQGLLLSPSSVSSRSPEKAVSRLSGVGSGPGAGRKEAAE